MSPRCTQPFFFARKDSRGGHDCREPQVQWVRATACPSRRPATLRKHFSGKTPISPYVTGRCSEDGSRGSPAAREAYSRDSLQPRQDQPAAVSVLSQVSRGKPCCTDCSRYCKHTRPIPPGRSKRPEQEMLVACLMFPFFRWLSRAVLQCRGRRKWVLRPRTLESESHSARLEALPAAFRQRKLGHEPCWASWRAGGNVTPSLRNLRTADRPPRLFSITETELCPWKNIG
jgi:hypothetical protein